jgi:UDP:flavonoid glycosyltransferase YjiC (YdhE family)
MRVLLSTIGSRGDVQPLVALASQLRAAGQEARLCVPPDFRDWIEGLGFPVTPLGPRLRTAGASRPRPTPSSPERLRQLAEATVAEQFTTIAAAAEGCDVIVAATALQIAARSVAEALGVGYAFAAFCPAVLPSPHHCPPPLPAPGGEQPPRAADNQELWARDAGRFNDRIGRRAVISSGWAGLALAGSEPGCLVIGEVNQQRLFRHVAAVVHHGGAGTTTTAALAGAPQVIIPQIYDQHYWARQVRDLGIGTAHAPGMPTTESLTAALRHALQPDATGRARSTAPAIRTDGAATAAGNVSAIHGPA